MDNEALLEILSHIKAIKNLTDDIADINMTDGINILLKGDAIWKLFNECTVKKSGSWLFFTREVEKGINIKACKYLEIKE